MQMPDFFAAVPSIRLYDPLADFLGAAADGIVEYGYADAVKLAGHSCPTVASAYWLTRQALIALCADALPERGGIRVEFAGAAGDGVTGVMAGVASLLTGAAGDGGFKGLAGQFARRNLLTFAAAIPQAMRFTRLDNGAYVDARADLGRIPADPQCAILMRRCLSGTASQEETQAFRRLWQERVRQILFDFADDSAVFLLRQGDQGHPAP